MKSIQKIIMSLILSALVYLVITVLVLYILSEYRTYRKVSFYTMQGVKCDWKPGILRLFSKGKKKSKNDFEIAQDLSEVYKGEDVVLTNRANSFQVCPLSPKALKEFFDKERDCTTRNNGMVTGDSWFLQDGEAPKRARALFKKVYNRQNLSYFMPTVQAALKDQIQVLKQKIESEATGKIKKAKINLRTDFDLKFFDNMATRLSLGDSPVYRAIPELDNLSFHQAVSKLIKLAQNQFSPLNMMTRGLLIKLGLSKKANETKVLYKRIMDYTRNVYDERVEAFAKGEYEPKRSNIMDFLILDNAKLKEEGKELPTSDEICVHLQDIIRAGFDTVMFVFENYFTFMLQQKECIQKLKEAIRKDFPNDDYTTDALVDHPYLHAVFMETNRLFPGINRSFSHIVSKNFKLCGVKIRKGDDIVIRYIALNYNKVNFPDPQKYDPKRFIDSKPPRFGFLPFSHGAKSCVGRVFGDFLVKVMLVELHKAFDFSFEEGHEVGAFHSDFASGLDSTVMAEVLGN